MVGVSESGYWAWARRAPSDRALYDAWLTERIRAVHAASSGRYGSPRVHAMLARAGIGVGEKRVARLMREEGVEPFGDLVGRDFPARRPGPRVVRGHQADQDR